MQRKARIGCVALAACLPIGGCHKSPPPRPAGTGAREAVLAFCEAVRHRDWPSAYSLLHSDVRGKCTEAQFADRANQYRSSLGFEPEEVHVGACQEQADAATAHVTWTGWAAAHHRKFKDSLEVRRTDGGWAVMLRTKNGL